MITRTKVPIIEKVNVVSQSLTEGVTAVINIIINLNKSMKLESLIRLNHNQTQVLLQGI